LNLRKTDKILILLPFWKGDRSDAMGLARLLADMEPAYSGAADFAFLARRDCKHDTATVNYVSKKFNTFTATSARHETGWPQGCNGTFFGGIDWCLRGISGGKLPAYKAIFNCAADTCPLVNDGLLYLHSEWDRLSKQGAKIAGAMVGGNGRCQGGNHINGDCTLISGDPEYLSFIARQAGSVIRGGGGWDWVLAPQFEMKGWANIPGIISQWKRGPFCEDEWDGYRAGGMKWLHGVKGLSLVNVARKRLLG
jgi:hypothetical protein